MAKCPKCGKSNAYMVAGKKIVCRNCGYDERTEVKEMVTKKTDEAVSPVIATILLIGICVILAATVMAFVMPMAGGQKAGHSIGITTKYNGGDIELMYHGGDGAATLTNIEVTLNDVKQADWLPSRVGELHTYTGTYTKPTKILIVAHYSDNPDGYIVMNTNI